MIKNKITNRMETDLILSPFFNPFFDDLSNFPIVYINILTLFNYYIRTTKKYRENDLYISFSLLFTRIITSD